MPGAIAGTVRTDTAAGVSNTLASRRVAVTFTGSSVGASRRAGGSFAPSACADTPGAHSASAAAAASRTITPRRGRRRSRACRRA